MVIAIIGVIAAISMAVLVRARNYSNEASAIASLRAINSAQSTYASSCGSGFYAPSLASLGAGRSEGGGDAFVGVDLNTDPSAKSTYIITLTPGTLAAGAPASCNGVAAGATVVTYFVGAVSPQGRGMRHFGTNQGATIYTSFTDVPVTQSGAPAGAQPIQ